MWSNPRARAAVDCGEMDGEEVRKETVEGNACGGKLSTMEARQYSELRVGGRAVTTASLPPHTSIRS